MLIPTPHGDVVRDVQDLRQVTELEPVGWDIPQS